MIKHLIILTAILCSAPLIAAQSDNNKKSVTTRTITGMVVDKNGNPLSGAEVRATGGAETVYTEADGSYSIEVPITLKSLTASYTGLRDSKLKTTGINNMIFTLKEYRQTHGFVNIVGAGVAEIGGTPKVHGIIPQVGIMGGAYRSWGGYAKFVLGGFGGPNIYDGYSDDDVFGSEPTVTGGVIKRLNRHCNLLVGAGVGFNYNIYGYGEHDTEYENGSIFDESYYEHKYPQSSLAIAGELGFMYHIRKFNIIAGVTYISPSLDGRENVNETYRSDYGSDNHYMIINHWSYDGNNSGNIAVFLSIGLHI